MRVLYDHHMFALQKVGGISRIFIELSRRLSQRRECDVYWHRGYHIDDYDVSGFRPRLARYWSIDRLPAWIERRWPRERVNQQAFRWFAQTIPGGVDVYHPSYFDPSLLPLVRSRRMAVTVYDMILERLMADLERFRPSLEGKRAIVERADLIFVISESTRRDAIELLGVDHRKTVLAYPASDMANVPAGLLPAELRGKPYLLHVGPRSKYKNFTVIQEAFARSERLRRELHVVCLGGPEFQEPEHRFFAEHGLADRFIRVTGDDSVLKALYQHAVAFVCPSRYEGFGIPALEALETGCPVICCPVTSIPEVVGDAALFFDPDRPDELVAQTEKLLDDTALRHDLVTRGKARAQRFSWDQTAEATLAGYRAIL